VAFRIVSRPNTSAGYYGLRKALGRNLCRSNPAQGGLCSGLEDRKATRTDNTRGARARAAVRLSDEVLDEPKEMEEIMRNDNRRFWRYFVQGSLGGIVVVIIIALIFKYIIF
jgi:hypothetical protein